MFKRKAKVDSDGTIRYFNAQNQLHREDGPAYILTNGTKKWFHYGNLHRVDGPAIMYAIGTEVWCKHGKLHREDGPAIIYVNGKREWWLDGKPQIKEYREYGTK